MPEITTIEKKFKYDLPDALFYQTNKLKKIGEWTYKGPDKIWIFIDSETHLIDQHVHYTERDNGAEVATPEGKIKVLVDASVNPDIASLICDTTDWSTLSVIEETLPDGSVYTIQDPLPPRLIYNLYSIQYDIDTETFVKPYPWTTASITLEDVIKARDTMLFSSDSKIRTCNPSKISEWEDYRQKLRDLPATYAGIDPWKINFPVQPTE